MAITSSYNKTLEWGGWGWGTAAGAPDLAGITPTATNLWAFGFDLTAPIGNPNGDGITETGFVVYPQGNAGTEIGDAWVTKITHANTTDDPYTDSVTWLIGSTAYCFRAYNKNNFGTSYGDEGCVTTLSSSGLSTCEATGSAGGSVEAAYLDGNTLLVGRRSWSTSVIVEEINYTTKALISTKTFPFPNSTLSATEARDASWWFDTATTSLFMAGDNHTLVFDYSAASGTAGVDVSTTPFGSNKREPWARGVVHNGKFYGMFDGRFSVLDIATSTWTVLNNYAANDGAKFIVSPDGLEIWLFTFLSTELQVWDIAGWTLSTVNTITKTINADYQPMIGGGKLVYLRDVGWTPRIYDPVANTDVVATAALCANSSVVVQGDIQADRVCWMNAATLVTYFL